MLGCSRCGRTSTRSRSVGARRRVRFVGNVRKLAPCPHEPNGRKCWPGSSTCRPMRSSSGCAGKRESSRASTTPRRREHHRRRAALPELRVRHPRLRRRHPRRRRLPRPERPHLHGASPPRRDHPRERRRSCYARPHRPPRLDRRWGNRLPRGLDRRRGGDRGRQCRHPRRAAPSRGCRQSVPSASARTRSALRLFGIVKVTTLMRARLPARKLTTSPAGRFARGTLPTGISAGADGRLRNPLRPDVSDAKIRGGRASGRRGRR